jgi:O-antigen/teichoic acid export membrane protein
MIKRFKNKFLTDFHFAELLRGSAIAFIFKILSMGLSYIFILFIAKWYGAETMGLYALAITILDIFVTLGIFGFDNALVKFVAEYKSDNKLYLVKEVYFKVLYIVVLIGLLLSSILYFNADFFAYIIFKKEKLSFFLQIISFALIPLLLLRVNATLFRGFQKIKLFSFFNGISVTFFSLSSLVIMTQLFTNFNGNIVIVVQVLSIVVVMLLSFVCVKKKYTSIFKLTSKNILKFKEILKISFSMLLASSMALVMNWTDVLILGMFRSETEVGVYSVVTKLASLTSIVLIAINTIAAPKFSEYYAKKDNQGLEKIVQSSTKMILFGSLPIILILLFFSSDILHLFGKNFCMGTTALWILTIGQLINVMTGSVGYILIMTGKEKIFQNIIIITSILNILLNYMLVEKFGLYGVALSTSVSLSLLNIISFLYIRHEYGFYTLNLKTLWRFE